MNNLDFIFNRDKFLLRQKHLSISEKYYIWDENENTLLFIEWPSHLFRQLLAIFLGLIAVGVIIVFWVMLFSKSEYL